MGNPNYNRGVRLERAVMTFWAKDGYTTMRTSGSHGPFDVLCLHPSGDVVAIQCKALKNGSKRQADNLVEKFRLNPPLPSNPGFTQMIHIHAMKAHYVAIGIV